MENVILFSGKHGDWQFSRRLDTPSRDVPAFLATVSALINQRGDQYINAYFDVSGLVDALDEIVRTRSDLDKAISAAVRSRPVQSAVSNIVASVAEDYKLDKKPAAAFKDLLKVFSVRYVLSQKIGDFEHVQDVGAEISPMGEGYFFVANSDGWVVVKKQRISDKTTPVDLLFYVASLSNTLHSKLTELVEIPAPDSRPKPSAAYELALQASDGGKDLTVFDAAVQRYFTVAGFPTHYGIAYDRIRPPKRIRGVKTK